MPLRKSFFSPCLISWFSYSLCSLSIRVQVDPTQLSVHVSTCQPLYRPRLPMRPTHCHQRQTRRRSLRSLSGAWWQRTYRFRRRPAAGLLQTETRPYKFCQNLHGENKHIIPNGSAYFNKAIHFIPGRPYPATSSFRRL